MNKKEYNIQITTPRLLLEPLSGNDAPFIFELVNTKGWLEFIGNRNVNSEADAIIYIQNINQNPHVVYWVIKLAHTHTPIGIVTLIKRDYLAFKDIGFALLPAFFNSGYAYEATKAILDNITEDTLFAVTIPENTSSIKLIEKLGLRFKKEIQQNKQKLHLYSS